MCRIKGHTRIHSICHGVHKVIAAISLEAPSAPLIEQLIGDDRMPHLAALQRAGQNVQLAPPFLDGSVYSTLYTGRHPSEHGIYSLFTWSPSEQRLRLSYDLMPADTLFQRLDRAGKRVLAIDPPEHPLQNLTNSIVVSGCQFQSRVHLAKWSRPSNVGKELSEHLGQTPRGEETFGQPSQHHLLYLRDILMQAPGRLAGAVERLLAEKTVDVLWVHMVAVHLAGHQFLNPAAVNLIGQSSAGSALLKNSLVDVYQAADAALGRIVKALPADANIFVFWPKGMGQETCRADLLPEMLKRILNPGAPVQKSSGSDALTKLRAMVPTSLRTAIADMLPDSLSLELTARLGTIGKDWPTLRAFSLPSDGPGLVRLNVRGRERNGIVAKSEVNELCNEISAGLRTYCDIDGNACIAGIERPGEHLPPGRALDHLPDLIIRWSNEQAIHLRGVTSPVYGTVLREGVGSGRSGNHVHGSRAIIVPRSGTYRPIKGRQPHLVDVTATVLAAAGVLHSDLPGQSLIV
ncbi:alkaline phosphatase family protein [Nitrospira sp. KM1]|uniref:alkaline phosphatase family protein n=1 Tax=Nitrospira sp. KM1 TaxID=1936990 RepID=UPI00351AAFA5